MNADSFPTVPSYYFFPHIKTKEVFIPCGQCVGSINIPHRGHESVWDLVRCTYLIEFGFLHRAGPPGTSAPGIQKYIDDIEARTTCRGLVAFVGNRSSLTSRAPQYSPGR